MRKKVALALVAGLVLALAAGVVPAGAARGSDASQPFNAKEYKKTHGYLPLKGVETLRQAKAHSAEQVENGEVAPVRTTPIPGSPAAPNAPTIGAKWKGVAETQVSPPDPNGAIGPNSYIETVNRKIGIYSRTGATIATANLSALTGNSGATDPMILWDPHTQRFYYNVLNINNARMDWGFSKTSNPTTIPGGFCNYETNFGYPTTSIPDYPKLGQTKEFLLIGINFYPTFSSQAATSADVLWIRKPQGTGAVTTCPAAPGSGKVTGLLNENGTQTFTPTPAIQTDPSSTGYVMSMSDIECPPICGTGTLLTVFTVTPTGSPATPVFSAPNSLTVGTYQSPANAQQPGTSNVLDTLDGRITHAVSGVDPHFGNATTVWTAHTVLAPAGAGIRWYEVNPAGAGSVVQNGIVAGASADIFNAGISNDRTCTVSQCAHGSAMVLGFTASSTSLNPTIAMVSKIGAAAMSGAVLVKTSATFDNGFTCSPCRWGDYGGATPDPAASLVAITGKVWLSQQYTKGGGVASSGDLTWNWEATP